MKLLLDTHLLIWSASEPDKLSREARKLIDDPKAEVFFSVVNIWEIGIKFALGKLKLGTTPRYLRAGLLHNAYREIEITSEHALAAASLPALHKDPFDRLLIAQAHVENLTLLTQDRKIASYHGSIRLV